jgi:hypothetical protein
MTLQRNTLSCQHSRSDDAISKGAAYISHEVLQIPAITQTADIEVHMEIGRRNETANRGNNLPLLAPILLSALRTIVSPKMEVLSPEDDSSHQRLLLATRYRCLATPNSSSKREVMLPGTSSQPRHSF